MGLKEFLQYAAIHLENRGGKDRKKLALRFVVVVRSSSRMFIEPYLQKYYLHTSFAKFPCCAPPKENHSKALSAQNLLKERPCHTNFQQSDSKNAFSMVISGGGEFHSKTSKTRKRERERERERERDKGCHLL